MVLTLFFNFWSINVFDSSLVPLAFNEDFDAIKRLSGSGGAAEVLFNVSNRI
jgi:hypothetical protein